MVWRRGILDENYLSTVPASSWMERRIFHGRCTALSRRSTREEGQVQFYSVRYVLYLIQSGRPHLEIDASAEQPGEKKRW